MEKNISFVKAPITNKTPQATISIKEVFSSITTNKYYRRITKEYHKLLKDPNVSDGDKRMAKGKMFDYATLSGEFSYISSKNIIQHSGYICLDIDKISEKDDLAQIKQQLIEDKILDPTLIFISPSNNGIKCTVRIDMEKANDIAEGHRAYFEAIEAYMDQSYGIEIDPACKDLARACFLAFDENAYFKEQAQGVDPSFVKVWRPELEINPHDNEINISGDTPWDGYNKDKKAGELLQRHGYTFVKSDKLGDKYLRPNHGGGSEYSVVVYRDTGLIYVHSSECHPLPTGQITPAKAFCLLEAGGDWSEAAKKLKERGYGKDEKEESKKLNLLITQSLPGDTTIFWDIVKNKKDKTSSAKINSAKYLHFLNNVLNIAAMELPGQDKLIPVRHENKLIYKIDFAPEVNRLVMDWLETNVAPYNHDFYQLLLEEFLYFHYKGVGKHLYESVQIITPSLLEETRDKCYLYFKNGYLEITAEEHTFHEYSSLEQYIWSDQVIKRNWLGEKTYYKFDFYSFVRKVTGEDNKRRDALMKGIGYVLHSYKDISNPKALILTDEKLTENLNSSQGGTGKGIICDALAEMRPTKKLDGQRIDTQATFVFQRVEFGDKILIVDDAKKDLNFEDFFVIITGDLPINRKYQGEIAIPFAESPKLVLSTNRAIKGNDPSHVRRQYVVELAPYFSKSHPVSKEYGRNLLWDYKEEDWQYFDSFMVACVQLYLKEGLSEVIVNYKKKQVLQEIGPELFEWLNEIIDTDTFYATTDLLDGKNSTCGFTGFRREYPEYKISSRYLPSKLEAWATYKGYYLNKTRNDSRVRGFIFEDANIIPEDELE